MKIMFGSKFLNDPRRKEERKEWENELLKNNKSITNAVSAVVDRKAISSELKNISCPTLILVGTQDLATPPVKAEFIHSKIKNSTLTYIDGGGHTSSIEEPEKYKDTVKYMDAFGDFESLSTKKEKTKKTIETYDDPWK